MRKVIPISDHQHWADYCEYMEPHPLPSFHPRRARSGVWERYRVGWFLVGFTALFAGIPFFYMLVKAFQ